MRDIVGLDEDVRVLDRRIGERVHVVAPGREYFQPIAITQIHHQGLGKEYFQRRLAEGDSRQRALRSLKRRLARVVFVRLHAQHRSG